MIELQYECPICLDLSASGKYDPVCYLNEAKGVYNCFRCQKGGTIDMEAAVKSVISTTHEPIVKMLDAKKVLSELTLDFSDEALLYLEERFPGLDIPSIIQKYNLMYHADKNAIAILTYSNGELIAAKYRLLRGLDEGLRYISEPGSMNGHFTIERPNSTSLMLVEGEFDAISVAEMGFEGTIWALGTSAIRKSRIKSLLKFKKLFMIPDNDQVGASASQDLINACNGRLNILTLPETVKDCNEFIQIEGIETARTWLKSSLITKEELATQGFSDALRGSISFLKNKKDSSGISTGYKNLDHKLGGGLRPGELTVINAYAKTGKSTLVNNLINMLLKKHISVGLASFEMNPERFLVPALLSMSLNTNARKLPDTALDSLLSGDSPELAHLSRLNFFKHFGQCDYGALESWIKYQAEHGVRFFFIDHAGFLMNDPRDATQNQVISKSLSMLATELAAHIFIVVQAPKVDSRFKPHLDLTTAYGGAAWAQQCFNYLTVERSKEHSDVSEVRLIASRFPGARASEDPLLLVYDAETGILHE